MTGPGWRAELRGAVFSLRNFARIGRAGFFELLRRKQTATRPERWRAILVGLGYLASGARPRFDPMRLFRTPWYLAANPGAAASGLNPLVHFLLEGAQAGLDPSPLFDTSWYLEQNPDVAAAGINPLLHYVTRGAHEGRDPHPLFDSDWYLAQNPDVAAAGINPLAHYLARGAAAGRDPNPDFDGDWYLRENRDVAAAGINPLVHYCLHGQWEGRAVSEKSALDQPYARSLRLDDPVTRGMLAAQRDASMRFGYRPLISILMPTYNTPARYLTEALDSVVAQTYDNWELRAVDDASSEPQLRDILAAYARRDPRIKTAFLSRNLGVSGATNQALERAEGEFIALLDHDDTLHPQALYRIVELLQGDRALDMIYSDEDKIDAEGRHYGPFFKPDWSPDYLLSMMYSCHLGAYRTALVREIGGFAPAMDGAQDYDMVLRLISRSQKVGHVPWVLYHWRAWPGSTALSHWAKPEAEAAARRALQRYLETNGHAGRVVEGPSPGHHRVIFDHGANPLVSIVMPTANGPISSEGGVETHLDACIASILAQTSYKNLEIVVVHNGNLRPEQQAFLRARGIVLLHYDRAKFNLPEKINIGAAAARGEQLLILNDDTRIINGDWIEQLLQFSLLPAVGAVGGLLYFPTGRIQHCGIVLLNGLPGHVYYDADGDTDGYGLMVKVPRNFLAVTGACMMVPRPVWEMLGGFDERYPTHYNDVDFCLRARERGLRICYTPHARLIHFEGASKAERAVAPEELALFKTDWGKKYARDPYYNWNLHQRFPYGVPPRC
jgi:glycosyltransferase involved in cell wall biosynthesis